MNNNQNFLDILQNSYPDAQAYIKGSNDYPYINGRAYFYQISPTGVLVEIEVCGLPLLEDASYIGFYGMHIHENGDCTPPFDESGNHYNPYDTLHPTHSGDMPVLLGNNGYAYSIFYTERYTVCDILNRSIIIHLLPDDYISQPSGNSGEKIACGVIVRGNMNTTPFGF